MSGVLQRLKLKQTPIDTWTLKEHLTLASAVLKNGDQNWVSVSRTMKQLGEAGRPNDWFKDKNCALQYNLLLEKADIPIRKRGDKTDSSESPAQRIVNKLAHERIGELQIVLEEERLEILRLEEQTQLLSSDDITEEQLDIIMKEIEAEEAEEDTKEQEAIQWLQSREEKKLAIQTALKSGNNRARFGQLKQQPCVSQSQSEQSGSEVDSAVESPVVDSLDSDSQQVDVESLVSTQPPPCETPQTPQNQSPVSTHRSPPTSCPASMSSPTQSPTSAATSPLLTSLLQSPTRQPGVLNFPMKSAAISNLAQKLASPATTFPSPVLLPPVMLGCDQATKEEDVDLKETLSDLDELLKKELEEHTKKEPVEVEPIPKEKIEIIEKTPEDVDIAEDIAEEVLEIVKPAEKDDDSEETDGKSPSRRPGRPRKGADLKIEYSKFKPVVSIDEESNSNKEKDDNEKLNMSITKSPASPAATLSPEVPFKDIVDDEEEILEKASPEFNVPKPESAPASPEESEEEKDLRLWRQTALGALDRIMEHRSSNQFDRPVADAEYRDMIYRPMDLGSIRSNLESGFIQSTEALLRDLNLVFLNSIMYNSSDNEVYALTVAMQAEANRIVREVVLEEGQTEKANTPPTFLPTIERGQRGRSVSGTGGESPKSSRSRTSSSGTTTEESRKRARTSSMQEDGMVKKRRLRTIEET